MIDLAAANPEPEPCTPLKSLQPRQPSSPLARPHGERRVSRKLPTTLPWKQGRQRLSSAQLQYNATAAISSDSLNSVIIGPCHSSSTQLSSRLTDSALSSAGSKENCGPLTRAGSLKRKRDEYHADDLANAEGRKSSDLDENLRFVLEAGRECKRARAGKASGEVQRTPGRGLRERALRQSLTVRK